MNHTIDNQPSPQKDFIPLAVPCMQGNEWKCMKECLDTNWVSSVGAFVDRFESELAAYVGIEHAVAMTNGTAAIHVALLVAGVKPEDEVIVPALTFVSPVNCVKYVGAHPVFMDVEPDYWQMDVKKLTEFLETQCVWKHNQLFNGKTVRRIAAVLPVDLLGHPVDLDPILELAKKYNFTVIEDATESLGAEYRGKKVGSQADLACFSFNGNKIITTGGGGMLVTDSKEFAERARYLSQQAKDDPIEYIHNEIGYNYRMTNVIAAIGCAQLEQLDLFVEKKRVIAQWYAEALKDIDGITLPEEASWAKSTFWLYTILVNKEKYGISSRNLLKNLQSESIQSRPLWHPIYKLNPFKNDFAYKIEVADVLYRTALSLPSSVDLQQEDVGRVVQLID